MPTPRVRFRLPDGFTCEATTDDVVGRSPLAAVRIDDQRVSTIHAEISRRSAGLVLIARGGRLLVGGRPVREALLTTGLVLTLAPGVTIEVLEVDPGESPVVPATNGRERLVFQIRSGMVLVLAGGRPEPMAQIGGVSAHILAELLRRGPSGAPWHAVAEAVWPEEGALRARWRTDRAGGWTDIDERRLRNRWDQQLVGLRRQMDTVATPELIRVVQGHIAIELRPGDRVEDLVT